MSEPARVVGPAPPPQTPPSVQKAAPTVAGANPAWAGSPVAGDLLALLRRGWWLGAGVLVLALASTAFFTSRQEPVYRASTMVVVTPDAEVEETNEFLRTLETLERRTVLATFARIPMAREAREALANGLQRELSEVQRFRIAAGVVPNTNVIRIDVDGPDPDVSAEVANAAAEHMRVEAAGLYRIFTMRPLAAARPSSRPIQPDPRRNLMIGGILGLFGAALAMFSLNRLVGDPRAR